MSSRLGALLIGFQMSPDSVSSTSLGLNGGRMRSVGAPSLKARAFFKPRPPPPRVSNRSHPSSDRPFCIVRNQLVLFYKLF